MKKLHELGARVTVNSDDPPFFNATIQGEYDAMAGIGFSEKELLSILTNLAKKSVETSEAVVVLFNDLSNAEQVQKIHRLETEADVLTRDIFSELNRTFITPLDREDMQRIASKISTKLTDEQSDQFIILDRSRNHIRQHLKLTRDGLFVPHAALLDQASK